MNLKVKDLKSIINLKLKEVCKNNNENNLSSNNLKKFSDDELTNFLDKFS